MTTTPGGTDGIIKMDTRGRLRVTRERREELLAEFDRSAMSGRKFAEWAGINYTTLANWLQKRRRQQASQTLAVAEVAAAQVESDPVRWVEAVVEVPKARPATKAKIAALVVHGPMGVRLELGDETQIQLAARFLRELGREPGC